MILQFDLYTCGDLDHHMVLSHLYNSFNIVSAEWQLLDRAEGFKLLDSYKSIIDRQP
jgi:hypothetical protein